MKTITLRESQAHYQIDLDENALAAEVLILEKGGHPVAAVVPFAEYETYRVWRDSRQQHQPNPDGPIAIESEHEAFNRMLHELLKTYRGRVVAMHHGQIVAVGDDRMEVWQRARQQLGETPIYVQSVEPTARIYKMPSRKIARVDL